MIQQDRERNLQNSAGRLINHILINNPAQDSLLALLFDYEEDRRKLRDNLEAQEVARKNETRSVIGRWLSDSIDEEEDHRRFCDVRKDFPNAGSWILEDPKIKDWMDNETPKSSLVWINGNLGAGKQIHTNLTGRA